MTPRNSKGQFTREKFTLQQLEGSITEYDRYVIVRLGQRDAFTSDEIMVEARIYLTLETDSHSRIARNIQFDDRVRIWCKQLDRFALDAETLPISDRLGFFDSKEFYSSSWRQAFTDAENSIKAELSKLKSAIEKRETALTEADYI